MQKQATKTRAKKTTVTESAPIESTVAPSVGIENIAPLASNVAPAIIPAIESAQPETTVTESAPYKTATRDASTVLAGAYNFANLSDRDISYIAFFAYIMRESGTATLAQIHNAGKPVTGKPALRRNFFYSGSAKATDSGAIIRLIKAGLFTESDNGNRLTATPLALASKAYKAGATFTA
jgi:hypothetical protein